VIYAELKDIVRLIVIVFDRTSIPPKAYKEKAKTKKKDYGDDNSSCCSDYRDSNSSESSEEGSGNSGSTSDEDETLQVLMSMTERTPVIPHIKRNNIGIYNIHFL